MKIITSLFIFLTLVGCKSPPIAPPEEVVNPPISEQRPPRYSEPKVSSGTWLWYNNSKDNYSIGYPSKIYYSWSDDNKWFSVVIEELSDGTKLALSPSLNTHQWLIRSTKLNFEDLREWAKDNFGASCDIETSLGSQENTTEVHIIDEDPEANVMNSKCRGAFTALRAVYHNNRKQLVWWDMSQESIYDNPDGTSYDDEMSKSFYFVDEAL